MSVLDEGMKQALLVFIQECTELLQTMEEDLLKLEDDRHNAELINAIFRAAHTIKGSSGLFGLDHVVRFTHVVENLLDEVRDEVIPVTSELIAVLLPCCDYIGELIRLIAAGDLAENLALSNKGEQLLGDLHPFLASSRHTALSTVDTLSPVEVITDSENLGSGNWHISLRFSVDTLREGMDPLSFIRYLSTLGQIVHMTTLTHSIPEVEQMDPESNYLGFEIDFETTECKEAIENVFEFVREDSIIHILPKESTIDEYIALIEALPEDSIYLGELLVKSGAITQRELDDGLKQQNRQQLETSDIRAPIGEILIEQQAVQQPIVNAALEKQSKIKDNKQRENQSIRVDAERLDRLIDLIGELVISGAGINLRVGQCQDPGLTEAAGEIMHLVEEVRDCALQLRMVPIGTTFSRFQRVVRDVSKELGKNINLIITGGETEIDKSVVEKIGDPLMHLVRNAMDHGIEPVEVRRAHGKSDQGTLRLNAYHASGNIVIEVSDDGGGLNKERIFQKAIEKGMINADAKLSDQEVFSLIFEPGFSTAQQVSNLSGRGVGMDVVKRNITELRGSIQVDSTPGEGTRFRIHLPLTLAIIDGFLVAVGQSSFVIPLDRVVECVELPTGLDNCDYMDLRGEVLPFIRLRPLFEIVDDIPRRENVVVVEHSGSKTGFIVDKLLGESQIVIKPLGKLFTHIRGIAGSTILGNGRVALILDVSTLIEFIDRHNHTQKQLTQHLI